MICTIAIQGYRSLRELVLPLGQLTVVTGANGSGKSSVYRSLRLLADAAQNAVIASPAREGGLSSTFWAGPETRMSSCRMAPPAPGSSAMQPLQPHSISTSRTIDFKRPIRRTTKPPARAGGFVQFANKVLIALP